MTRYEMETLRDHYKSLINELLAAKLALIRGGVKSYTIGDRSLTRLDLGDIDHEVADARRQLAEIEAKLAGRSARKAVRVVPRDN